MADINGQIEDNLSGMGRKSFANEDIEMKNSRKRQ